MAQRVVGVLRLMALQMERSELPPGFLERNTGRNTVPFLVSGLEVASRLACAAVTVVLLNVDILVRSLLMDSRGEDLLGVIIETMHASSLRGILHTGDGMTALRALSPTHAQKVLSLPSDRAGVGVLVVEGEAAEELDEDDCRARARFEWQMNEVLAHPALLNYRLSNSSSAVFTVFLWETLRHMCSRSHLPAPSDADKIEHPVVQAMLHASMLEPRWGPTRFVLPEQTKTRILRWIDARHAELAWQQRVEYSIQLVRERSSILRRLDRMAW